LHPPVTEPMLVGPAGLGAWPEPVASLGGALDPLDPVDSVEAAESFDVAAPVGVDTLETGSLEEAGDGDAAASVTVGAGDLVERCAAAGRRGFAARLLVRVRA
jgi:hypothetical protein